jgi:HlyD family secretion protein
MATAKAINLKVRPLQSVDLCFPIDGVIGEQSDIHLLGKAVTGFDLPMFCDNLLQPVSAGSLEKLKFDSQAIRTALQPSILYALRAEPTKAALDKAIAQRENSFLQKYKDKTGVITRMQADFGTAAGSKTDRLNALKNISQSQFNDLDSAYTADGWTVVRKKTYSDTTGDTTDSNKSDATNNNTSTGSSTSGGNSTSGSTTSNSTGNSSTNDTSNGTSHTDSSGKSHSDTHTDNFGYDYRHPSLENSAQYQRAQVALLDERFSHFMFAQTLPFLNTVFDNEVKAIDMDVKRLQVSYLDTMLLSPIDGIVTGVFRDKGDCVRAGQAVMRVENDKEILIVGTLKFRGLISIGSNVQITTKIFDSPTTLTATGKVVSVRGHDAEDEQWDLLILGDNRDGHGNPIFPINYNFDYDDTTINIS